MKVYVTKYALTTGIEIVDGHIDDVAPSMFCVDLATGYLSINYHKPHWHKSRDEAIAQAEKMRVKKIASLKNQLAKLESMKIECPVIDEGQ